MVCVLGVARRKAECMGAIESQPNPVRGWSSAVLVTDKRISRLVKTPSNKYAQGKNYVHRWFGRLDLRLQFQKRRRVST